MYLTTTQITYDNRPQTKNLKAIVGDHYLTFEAVATSEGYGGLPKSIQQTFEAFFTCGEISEGFALLSCKGCKSFDICGFSCKKRGFCSRCAARRGTSHTIHLMDHVLPEVDVRQWVITFPPQIRYLMAIKKDVVNIVHRISGHEIALFYERMARKSNIPKPISGSVSFLHMTGSALNLAPHFHMLFVDGIYEKPKAGKPMFSSFPPSRSDIEIILAKMTKKVLAKLLALGFLEIHDAGDDSAYSVAENLRPKDLHSICAAASIGYQSAIGEHKGKHIQRMGRVFGLEGDTLPTGSDACHLSGFSIHAATKIKGHQRGKLEKLVSYVARPMVSETQIELCENGDITYHLKKPWSDGTTGISYDPIEFLERLMVAIPHPWKNLVVYSGIFAPNSKIRNEVVPNMPDRRNKAGNRTWHIPWPELLARSFKIDLFCCPNCKTDSRRVLAFIAGQKVEEVAGLLGLSTDPPTLTPSRIEKLKLGDNDITYQYFD